MVYNGSKGLSQGKQQSHHGTLSETRPSPCWASSMGRPHSLLRLNFMPSTMVLNFWKGGHMQEAPGRDSKIAVMDNKWCHGWHVFSCIQRTWTFITQIKHAGDTSLSVDTFFAKLSLICVFQSGTQTSMFQYVQSEQDSSTGPQRMPYCMIIGNRPAMHCVVLTRGRLSVSSQALWCVKYQGL